ncbi:hypothetical protein A3L12_04200 [Thermococcus sp. P6]|uniref:DUF2079 domain-containing protein n=1 Tax=Thermococcus sp. P6 TaxID=122420 RepID=UPI000B605147|nr:DUF2079 domain-containing protein [Thermococcus sp. P6]ASJ10554.1 hypothetical protein A3L12_04200 [Thermococcus sp. P6]
MLTWLCLERYDSFGYRSLDLGIFTQSLASTLKGRFFYNTVEYQWHGVTSHFGAHNQPILFLLLPLYALFPSPKTLLTVQSLALASSIYLAFELAENEVGEERALALTVLYALNSSLLGIGIFEFHPVSLAVPLLLLGVIMWRRGRKLGFLLISLLLLSVKEDTALGVLSLAAYEILRSTGTIKERLEKNRMLIGIALLSLVWLFLGIKLFIPHFRTGGYIYAGLYDGFKLDSRKLLYFMVVNLTFGLLPLLRPENTVLLALPWAESLLSVRGTQTMIGFHYAYMIVPLSFIASVDTVKGRDLKDVLTPLLIAGILTSMATYPITSSPLLQNRYVVYAHTIDRPDERDATIWKIINVLKNSNCSIYTQPEFYPPLAGRLDVYLGSTDADVLLFDTKTYNGRKFKRRFGKAIANYILAYSKEGIEVYVRKDLTFLKCFESEEKEIPKRKGASNCYHG